MNREMLHDGCTVSMTSGMDEFSTAFVSLSMVPATFGIELTANVLTIRMISFPSPVPLGDESEVIWMYMSAAYCGTDVKHFCNLFLGFQAFKYLRCESNRS